MGLRCRSTFGARTHTLPGCGRTVRVSGERQTREEKSLLLRDKPPDQAVTPIPNLLNSRENRTRVSLHRVLRVGGAKDAFGGAEWVP